MNNPSSDQKLVKFLNQHRPNLPEAAPDLEQKVLAAIESSEVNSIDENNWEKTRLTASPKYRKRLSTSSFFQWVIPGVVAAGLLVLGSGYRAFNTAQLPDDETAHLEAFLVTNWEGVLHDSRTENTSDSPQSDWLTFPATADTEPPTNN